MKNYFYLFCFILPLLNLPLFSQSFQQAKPWMGVAIEDREDGVGIRDSIPGTPAEKAGLRQGDVIKKIDSIQIKDSKQLISLIQAKGVGNEVVVEFERNSKLVSLTLKLESRPDDLEVIKKKSLGKNIPQFSLEKIQETGYFSNPDISNTVTVIEFWATWCPACVGSHKKLSAFAESNPSIKVLAVSNEKKDVIQKYENLIKPKFITLRDNTGDLVRFFSVSAIPMTVVLDRKGEIKFITLGSGSYLEEALNFAQEISKNK